MSRLARIFILMLGIVVLLPASANANRIYKLKFHTDSRSGAGTDSNIKVKLYGLYGNSDWHTVNSHISGNAFERSDWDTTSLSLDEHGPIWKIDLKSDGKYTSISSGMTTCWSAWARRWSWECAARGRTAR